MTPTKHTMSVLAQITSWILDRIIENLARKHRIQTRSFSATSHVISMGYAHLAHALSLNDICDSLSNHAGTLRQIRGCTPPSRNGLSHANKTRSADMAVSKEKRQNVSINVRINRTQGRILQCILEKPDITSKTLAERLELSPRTIARALQYLQQTNIIQRTGSRKNGSWLVVKGE